MHPRTLRNLSMNAPVVATGGGGAGSLAGRVIKTIFLLIVLAFIIIIWVIVFTHVGRFH